MFGGNQYLFAIPLPKPYPDEMNKLVYAIAEKSGQDPKKLTSQININAEFHITLGIFDPKGLETNKKLFRKIVSYLNVNEKIYIELKKILHGECIISGIGFYGNDEKNLINNEVVWASVESEQVTLIRKYMHEILNAAGVNDDNFHFTDPHITLMTKKNDIHGIPKTNMIPLGNLIKNKLIDFKFKTVNFQGDQGKIIWSFGDEKVDGRPSMTYKKFAKSMGAVQSQGEAQLNWSALFKHPDYRKDAKQIKEMIQKNNIGILFKLFDQKKAIEIKNLLSN